MERAKTFFFPGDLKTALTFYTYCMFGGGHMTATVNGWRSEGSLQESVLSGYSVGSVDGNCL